MINDLLFALWFVIIVLVIWALVVIAIESFLTWLDNRIKRVSLKGARNFTANQKHLSAIIKGDRK
jgi:cell division septal protein FtsQ